MPDNYRLVELPSVDSTNSYARSLDRDPDSRLPFVVITDNQTGGRGQRGNKWESQPGKNLTFSLVVYPDWLSPSRQFELSMLVSLGIIRALEQYVPDVSNLKIKWPNDIYYGDKKLAGILIENSIGASAIERSVIGIGLNVNQLTFLSDAPNPVSLAQISGHDFSLKNVLDTVVKSILDCLDTYEADPEVNELTYLYNTLLWRRDGKDHLWRDVAHDITYTGSLERVDADGRLHVKATDGTHRTYLFKEVESIL